mmetsp:Transcript_1732/g.2183  ORF Transcript_1732/g.2183 Transcript_1732/m.2183 type:complete len:237 (-) Transcript_1732:244-954(-)
MQLVAQTAVVALVINLLADGLGHVFILGFLELFFNKKLLFLLLLIQSHFVLFLLALGHLLLEVGLKNILRVLVLLELDLLVDLAETVFVLLLSLDFLHGVLGHELAVFFLRLLQDDVVELLLLLLGGEVCLPGDGEAFLLLVLEMLFELHGFAVLLEELLVVHHARLRLAELRPGDLRHLRLVVLAQSGPLVLPLHNGFVVQQVLLLDFVFEVDVLDICALLFDLLIGEFMLGEPL